MSGRRLLIINNWSWNIFQFHDSLTSQSHAICSQSQKSWNFVRFFEFWEYVWFDRCSSFNSEKPRPDLLALLTIFYDFSVSYNLFSVFRQFWATGNERIWLIWYESVGNQRVNSRKKYNLNKVTIMAPILTWRGAITTPEITLNSGTRWRSVFQCYRGASCTTGTLIALRESSITW